MYFQEIYIDIISNANHVELVKEFQHLMVYYNHNGQIQDLMQSVCIRKDKMFAIQNTIERMSLDHKYDNNYVKEQSKKIEILSESIIKFRMIAKPFVDDEPICECEKSDFYILFTTFYSISSPLTCGSCMGKVPLYRLPKYTDDGYIPILEWQSDYSSCDTLQINCNVGERWALNQMENHNSKLSRLGRSICKKIEELSQIPTYYYLHDWTKMERGSLSRTCPNCNQRWDIKEEVDEPYEFKCNICRLVSAISPNT